MAAYTVTSVYDPTVYSISNYVSILIKIIANNYPATKFVAPCPIRRWNGTSWVLLYTPVT